MTKRRKVRGSNPQGLVQPRRFSRALPSPIGLTFRASGCGNDFMPACQDYEVSLVWRNRIDEFQKSGLSPYPASPHASMAARVIVAWERFKTGG